jgi:hypothetical protein
VVLAASNADRKNEHANGKNDASSLSFSVYIANHRDSAEHELATIMAKKKTPVWRLPTSVQRASPRRTRLFLSASGANSDCTPFMASMVLRRIGYNKVKPPNLSP